MIRRVRSDDDIFYAFIFDNINNIQQYNRLIETEVSIDG